MSKRTALRRRRTSPGFTLIELLVATILSTIVLMGVFSIMTNMVTTEVNAMRNGTVTSWSLAGLSVMNTDIAGAGAIAYPPKNAVGDNNLIVCTNWSMKTTPPAVVVTGGTNKILYYCWDTTDATPFQNAILRKEVDNPSGGESCPTAPIACNHATYGNDAIVATGVYSDGVHNLFVQDPLTLNAVRMRFIVGNPAANAVSAGSNNEAGVPGTVNAVPVSIPFNTEIILED